MRYYIFSTRQFHSIIIIDLRKDLIVYVFCSALLTTFCTYTLKYLDAYFVACVVCVHCITEWQNVYVTCSMNVIVLLFLFNHNSNSATMSIVAYTQDKTRRLDVTEWRSTFLKFLKSSWSLSTTTVKTLCFIC